MEIWETIPGYEKYQASDQGKIKNQTKIMKQYKNKEGRMEINLSNGKRKNFKVHRLIMLAFVGESNLEVNHINGIPFDNRLKNLEYCTRSENAKHKYRKLGFKSNFQTKHWNLGGKFSGK